MEEDHNRLLRAGAGITEAVQHGHAGKTGGSNGGQKVPFWFSTANSTEPVVKRTVFSLGQWCSQRYLGRHEPSTGSQHPEHLA